MTHEQIIAKVDILKLIEKLGLEGKVQGKEFITHCPFPEHDDKTPSFSIAIVGDAMGKWRCFGCGAKGNSLHLVQRVLNIEREQAEKQIAQWFGFPDSLNFPSTAEISKMLEEKKQDEEEIDLVRIPLPKVLDDKSRIIEYLMMKRKYTEKQAWDIINFFNLAWVDSGYYAGRLIIPIYDSLGSLVTFEARDMTGMAEKKALYPKGSPVGHLLFNNHNLSNDLAWITEGIWDAVRLWTFGEPALATFGAHITNHQAQMLIDKYENIFLLFDGDEAGQRAREESLEKLKPYVNVFEMDLWYGDPADLTREEFKEILRQLNIRR